MSRDDIYCDLVMTTEEGLALLELVKQLRAEGKHHMLDQVFRQIEQGVEGSLDYNANFIPFSMSRRKPH